MAGKGAFLGHNALLGDGSYVENRPSKWRQTWDILSPYVTKPAMAVKNLMDTPLETLLYDTGPKGRAAAENAFDVAGTFAAGSSVVPKPRNALNMGIRAYHVSPYDFDQFDPARSFRKASFFARTPQEAAKGASAGAGDWYGTRPSGDKTYEVDIGEGSIAGLDLTPSEKIWWQSLPDQIETEEGINQVQKTLPRNFDAWWRVYDEVNNGDDTFRYVKRQVPSLSYEEAAKSGRNVYGSQFPHYGGYEPTIADKVKAQGMKGYAIQDEAGLSLAIVDPYIVEILRKYGMTGLLPAGVGGAALFSQGAPAQAQDNQ